VQLPRNSFPFLAAADAVAVVVAVVVAVNDYAAAVRSVEDATFAAGADAAAGAAGAAVRTVVACTATAAGRCHQWLHASCTRHD